MSPFQIAICDGANEYSSSIFKHYDLPYILSRCTKLHIGDKAMYCKSVSWQPNRVTFCFQPFAWIVAGWGNKKGMKSSSKF